MKKRTNIALISAFVLFICYWASCVSKKAMRIEDYEPGAQDITVATSQPGYLGTEVAEASREDNLPAQPDVGQRQVIYVGVLGIVVDNISQTMENVRNTAESMGGYMQEMGSNWITVKVPAARFEEVIDTIEKMGEVTRKEIKGTDVTEEMMDLKIRLDNAEEFRKRLLKLYDKATKMEDMLQIEKELQRVTETIETLKGKIQYLEKNVAYSTLRVELNSSIPQSRVVVEIPFEWVRTIGDGLARPTMENYGPFVSSWSRIKFDLPESYVLYYQKDYRTMAISADNNMIVVRRHENYKGGSLEFWRKLIRRQLVEVRAFSVKGEDTVSLDSRDKAVLFTARKEIGKQAYAYILAVASSDDYVYTYEAWGLADKLEPDLEAIEKSIKSMKID